jgi:hypothetical protein
MRGITAGMAFGIVLAAAVPAPAQDQVIDRVLATVDGHVITLSDVRAVRALGLVRPLPQANRPRPYLEALVDRVLVLEEVERYQPPEPDPAAVERGVAEVRAAHASSYETALRNSGLDESFVRQWVHNDLRIEGYLGQRFAGVLEPSEDDLEAYRRTHPASGPPADEQHLRAAVVAERRAALVREWIDGLRARAEITMAPVPE